MDLNTEGKVEMKRKKERNLVVAKRPQRDGFSRFHPGRVFFAPMPFIRSPSSGSESGVQWKKREKKRGGREGRKERKTSQFFVDSALFRGEGDGETILLARSRFSGDTLSLTQV